MIKEININGEEDMGLDIKRNIEGLYNINSSISDECVHDKKWITEDEAKQILMEREFFRYLEKIIEIEMNFPFHYNVNGRIEMQKPNQTFNEWYGKVLDGEDNIDNILIKKVREISKKYDIAFVDMSVEL